MKIGGINAKLLKDEVLNNYLYKNNTLVIGVDVVHPSAVETYLPSVAAVVGNVDVTVTKFKASVKIQSARQELITDFVDQFSERIMEYSDVNGSALKNIIVFRDGISKGQFKQVLEEELLALRRVCKKFASNYRPHHGIQGTSTPTRYYVLFDESNMDVNAMQLIACYLCHIYVCARAPYHFLAAFNSVQVKRLSDENKRISETS
ncbi:hypothetical protein TSPI_01671 [Trichinella spiralis]|uniref:Piwi domain-containing protein n=1 Tax=Trichinella spiralis TaxID=6334 RepID=A0ABR3KCJ7_TRISP